MIRKSILLERGALCTLDLGCVYSADHTATVEPDVRSRRDQRDAMYAQCSERVAALSVASVAVVSLRRPTA